MVIYPEYNYANIGLLSGIRWVLTAQSVLGQVLRVVTALFVGIMANIPGGVQEVTGWGA